MIGHMVLGVAAAKVGDTTLAGEMLRWHEENTAKNDDNLIGQAAIVLALGRRDDAIQILRQASKDHPLYATSHNGPGVQPFMPLRDDPRFEALLAARK